MSPHSPPIADRAVVDAARARNKTLPLEWYWSQTAFDFEMEQVFARTWHLAGPLELVRRPGDQMLCRAGLVPVVVVRGHDGVLRGFVNVCRHRGYAVVTEPRSRGTLQCMYHGWTYDLDGSLRSAPSCSRGEFDDKQIALLPVSIDVWNNLVFVNPDPDAASLDSTFPELREAAERWEMGFSTGFSYQGESSYQVLGNWKAWCENTNECYHCPTIHKGSYDATFRSLKDRDVLITDNLIGAVNGYRDSAPLLERHDARPTFGERYLYLFPGTFISKDDYLAFAGTTVPLGPELTAFVSHTWVRDGVAPALLEDWNAMWDETLREDADAVRIQQAGLSSRALDFGQLSAEADTMILKFHELVWRAYRAATERGPA